MGGECVRLIWAALGSAVADHPAERKQGELRIEELTLMSRSPTPSLIVARYEVRSCQMVNLRPSKSVSQSVSQSVSLSVS